jgi:hypothetical protein
MRKRADSQPNKALLHGHLLLVALLLDDERLGGAFETMPTRIRAPPAIRVATCVHDPSGFFSKASQGRSARPVGYEVIV